MSYKLQIGDELRCRRTSQILVVAKNHSDDLVTCEGYYLDKPHGFQTVLSSDTKYLNKSIYKIVRQLDQLISEC